MTESPAERSKRKFLEYFSNYDWYFQISVMYQNYDDRFRAIEDSKILRKALPREYPDNAFLWRLCLTQVWTEYPINSPDNKAKVVMPYNTFFTNHRVSYEEFGDFADKLLGCELYVKGKRLSNWKYNRYKRTVKAQKPHDLKQYFGDDKINRFSLINKKKATFFGRTVEE